MSATHQPFHPLALLTLAALTAASASAQDPSQVAKFELPPANSMFTSAAYSSSSSSVTVSSEDVPSPAPGVAIARPVSPIMTHGVRPFSGMGLAFKVGTNGIGVDVSTPFSQHFAVRTGASFFSYNTSLTQDGMDINGALKLQSASASLDIYPFHNSFRISPGFSYANHNHLDATLLVPGGQTFSFGDGGTYYSDSNDPVHGTAAFQIGKTLSPKMTVGWGNIMPHAGSRVSFPVELGFQYISTPTVRLQVTGSSCGSQVQADGSVESGCGPVDQTDVAQEQAQLQSDLSGLRFYPVASLGISFRIGHGRRSE